MKKMKALLLSLALGLTVAATVTAVGCNESNPADSTSSDWFSSEVEENVSVRFEQADVNVYQYEGVKLTCAVRGTTSAITYSSSDESIATVDENGNVTAKDKVGEVTITASVEDDSATCKVNVQKSPYAPQIVLNAEEYTIEEGETLEFTVETEWNKTVLTEDIEYSVSLAENSKGAKSTVSAEGNTVKVVGGEVETIDVIVSATVRGLYTSESFTVNVVGAKLKLQPTNLAYQPAESGYAATLSSTDQVGNMANSLPLEFVAAKGTQQLESVAIDWTVDGDKVVIEDGQIVGQKRGVATLTGTATYEGETAEIKVVCDVVAPEVRLEETAVLEVEALANLKMPSGLIGSLQNAELHGVQVGSRIPGASVIIFNKANFPKEASKLGAQELVINTDVVRYVMDVEVYTMIINTAEELDQMRTIANTGETEWSIRFAKEVGSEYYDGYYVLGNDIDYNKTIMSMTDTGTVWGVQGYETEDRGFKGVFDGKGYNIDGVTVGKNPSGSNKQAGGIFGYVATGGIVKNVSFTNATLLTNTGFICSRGNGTIENVSISYKKLGGDGISTEGLNTTSAPNVMGSFFSKAAGSNATVRNCLIDASAADITVETGTYMSKKNYNINLVGAVKNVENVITLCPDAELLSVSGADVTRKSYLELIAEQGLFMTFDKTIWTTVEGIPMFVKQAANLDRSAPVAFLNTDSTLIAGFDMIVRTNNPYVKIELLGTAEETAGVTYADSLLTATEEGFRKTVTLKATSLLDPTITATHDVYIDSFGMAVDAPANSDSIVVYNTDPVLKIGDNSWMGAENYVYLGKQIIGSGATEIEIDYKACEWGNNEVTVVSVKDGEREHFKLNLKVWYTVGDFAASKVVADNAFSTYKGSTFTDAVADLDAPEGYEKVTRIDSAQTWISAMGSEFFNREFDTSGYTDLWFAIRSVNITKYVFQTKEVQTSGWIYFHYTQTSEDLWVAEVTVDGKVHTTEFNIDGSAHTISKLLYRSGWADGFLIYNNNGPTVNETTPTQVYSTEIRGIKA